MRKLLVIVLIFSLFFLFPKSSHAASSFSTDYNVTYTVKDNAQTHVSLNVVLTNLTDKYYASSYDIQAGFSDIKNAKASDEAGSITPKITENDKGSIINLTFNNKNLGLNSKLNFNLSFDTDEIAQDLGNVWDVNIPGISSQNDFSSFNVSVVYPQILGKPTFIKPYFQNALENISNNTIVFNKEELGSSGISLAFGDYQTYDFNLVYHLENTNVFSIKTEVALPPSTNYQDIYIKNISPKPENVTVDKDGNWLATFIVKPSQKQNVVVLGQAKVFLRPRQEELSSNQIKEYLKKKDYWQTDNPEIVKLAKTLKTAQKIYEYVVSNLEYDFSRIETNSPRLGAAGVLRNPSSAVCLEFTDLFIALSRAAGIPARAVEGYAYTDNSRQRPLSLVKDILHAWPQYYDFDKKTWVMVDPTWGNTTNGIDYFDTLDFDHLAFVVKGQSSTYPIPAGGYKLTENENSKDVNVDITKTINYSGPQISSSIDMKSEYIAGFPILGKVKIENNGDSVLNQDKVYVYSERLLPLSQTLSVSSIPPFGFVLVDFSLFKTDFLTKKDNVVKIAVGKNIASKEIKVLPFFLSKWFIAGGILIVSTILFLSLTIAGYRSVSVYRQKRKDNLRGEGDKPPQESL